MTFRTTLKAALRRTDAAWIDDQKVDDTRLQPESIQRRIPEYVIFDFYDTEGELVEVRAPADQLIAVDEHGKAEITDMKSSLNYNLRLAVYRPLREEDT